MKYREQPGSRRVLWVSVIVLLLFMAAWAPRVLALDAFVTIDERKWLNRSANFYYALRHKGFAATFQTGHPGVTVMWAGTAGFLQTIPTYAQAAPKLLTDQEMEAWLAANSSLTPLDLLVAGRRWMVLAIALLVAGMYFPLRTLFGRWPAYYALLFLAWDPFFVGLSRQLHPDGLLATLTTLAVLSLLAWLYGGRRGSYLVVAGLTTGLAVLTKSPALLVIPAAALLFLLESLPGLRVVVWRPRDGWRIVGWGMLAALTFVAFWPAAWVNPLRVFAQVLAFGYGHSAEGHALSNFFFRQTTVDPGPLFYPVTYFFRTTPAAALGLLAALVWVWRRRFPLDSAVRRRATVGLGLFALLFIVGMTAGQKKFDRYLLPVHLVLDIVASLGWVGIAYWLGEQLRRLGALALLASWARSVLPRPRWTPVALASIVMVHGVSGFVHFPYYLTYYNPLAGGSRTAEQVLLVGWGEGLDKVAAWLNQQPDAEQLRVVSWYGDGPLSYYLDSKEAVLPFFDTQHYWFDADYAVLYVNQWQRNNPEAEVVDYFLARAPAYVVEEQGLELARVYDMGQISPPEFTHIYALPDLVFADKIALPAFRMAERAGFPGESVELTLFLQGIEQMEMDYEVAVQLVSPDGAIVWQEQRSPAGVQTSDWPLHVTWDDTYQIPIPATAGPGLYTVTVAFPALARPAISEVCTSTPAHSARQAFQQVTEIQVQLPQLLHPHAGWERVQVTSLRHQPTLVPGQTLLVDLAAAGQVDGSLKISLRLVDPANNLVAQSDKPLTPDLRFELTVPEDAEPSAYSLTGVVYDPETLAALPDLEGNYTTELSHVSVQTSGNGC